MPSQPLPSYFQFLLSSAQLGKMRRSKLSEVDGLLREWNSSHTGWNNDRRLQQVEQLLAACDIWLQDTHADDAGSRREGVQRLRDLVMEHVQHIGRQRFDQRKQLHGVGTPQGHLVQPVQPAYMAERTMFTRERERLRNEGVYSQDKSVTIDPIAGSFVNLRHDAPERRPAELLHVNKAHLTLEHYEQYFREQRMQSADPVQVRYLRKEQRLQYLITFRNGKLYQNASVLDTGEWEPGQPKDYMYAMDLYGNLFAMNERQDYPPTEAIPGSPTYIAQGLARFNHTTLNAGREVVCAGTLVAKDGDLLAINNLSGHYAPTWQNLRECLTILRDEDGVDLSKTLLLILLGHNQAHENVRASSFLQNPDRYAVPRTAARMGTTRSQPRP